MNNIVERLKKSHTNNDITLWNNLTTIDTMQIIGASEQEIKYYLSCVNESKCKLFIETIFCEVRGEEISIIINKYMENIKNGDKLSLYGLARIYDSLKCSDQLKALKYYRKFYNSIGQLNMFYDSNKIFNDKSAMRTYYDMTVNVMNNDRYTKKALCEHITQQDERIRELENIIKVLYSPNNIEYDKTEMYFTELYKKSK